MRGQGIRDERRRERGIGGRESGTGEALESEDFGGLENLFTVCRFSEWLFDVFM